jgi:sugar phosphate permease
MNLIAKISAALGAQIRKSSGETASSSAVGLTGLFGYLGASLCGVATGVLADGFGWDGVLWFYAGSAVIGAALLATTWSVRTPGR